MNHLRVMIKSLLKTTLIKLSFLFLCIATQKKGTEVYVETGKQPVECLDKSMAMIKRDHMISMICKRRIAPVNQFMAKDQKVTRRFQETKLLQEIKVLQIQRLCWAHQ